MEQALKTAKNPTLLADAWGHTYEDYISERLTSAFGTNYLADIKNSHNDQIIDGLLVALYEAFPIEIKYPHWTYKARLTGRKEDMRKFIDRFLWYRPRKSEPGGPVIKSKKGLGQIKNFVLKYREGSVEPRVMIDAKVITPILVLGEPFPPDPMNRVWLEGVANNAGCNIPDTKPFIYCSQVMK